MSWPIALMKFLAGLRRVEPSSGSFKVYCPDGVDRLRAAHRTLREAEKDAGYFSARSSCHDWCWLWNLQIRHGDPTAVALGDCPGGIHTARPPKEEPEELAWTIELAFIEGPNRMAEIKKVWVVRDGVASDLDDPAIKSWPGDLEENILAQFMWEMDVDQLVRVIHGSPGATWWDEHTKLYDDASSARRDAEARIKKLRSRVERKTAAERVADRFATKSGRTMHLEGKPGHTLCGETAHKDTIVDSVTDATCFYCVQAWKKKHGGI